MCWRISFFGKPRKSDVSDLRTLKCRYRVNPISVPTFPGYALASDLDQSQAFAAPMADPGDHDLRQWTLHRSLKSGVVASRKQVALADRKRGNREVHRELWLRPVTDMGAACPHGKLRMIGEEGALLARCR